MSLVQADSLTKIYGKGETAVTALDHVNLVAEAGSKRMRTRSGDGAA